MNTKLKIPQITHREPSRTRSSIASCRKLLAQIEATKNTILAEFRGALAAHEQLLRLALNEAEALAWQTPYPHLFFPTLPLEKVEGVSAWQARQRSLYIPASSSALAA